MADALFIVVLEQSLPLTIKGGLKNQPTPTFDTEPKISSIYNLILYCTA